ncbi:nucleotide sugar dehydrogenase [Serpentinicella alkaliphila]|nr:nucleotide sugar dehydrogenase [Serpentinicella alkaliphila]QUH27037.1 nucleotide sugar dehydrogenase [Serpentinicella alkaliphila]
MTLKERIIKKEANIGVIGLGYVGLPLAIAASLSGYKVTGIDTDKKKIINILLGRSYIKGIEDSIIVEASKSGNLIVTHNIKRLESMDVLIICVPTPLDKEHNPDVTFINEVVTNIKKYSKKNCLIILESTTYPGTTQELIKEELDKLGWALNEHYNLCFSPERVDPGNKKYGLRNTPKVVGGISKECTELGALFYKEITDNVKCVSSASVAEMAKLLENTFRFINIALVNELSVMCDKMGINIWEVIDAAATKPFGFMEFFPGPGVGGHCIPIDPIYLNWRAKSYNVQSELIKLSTQINNSMPEYVVNSIINILKKSDLENCKILVIGVAYKRDIDDIRESPAIPMIKSLKNYKAGVDFYDPYIKEIDVNNEILYSIDYLNKDLSEYDCIIIVTNHTDINYNYISQNGKMIYDTRNSFNMISGNIITLGGGLSVNENV